MAAMELIPSLGEVGITSCVNGPTIWTGDSLARGTNTCGECVRDEHVDVRYRTVSCLWQITWVV